jgi:hypothetical protein
MENISRGPTFGYFVPLNRGSIASGRHLQDYRVQEYRLPSPPLLNLMYCLRVSLWTVKMALRNTKEKGVVGYICISLVGHHLTISYLIRSVSRIWIPVHFLTPRSGSRIRDKFVPYLGSRIHNPYFRALISYLVRSVSRIWVPVHFLTPRSGSRIGDKFVQYLGSRIHNPYFRALIKSFLVNWFNFFCSTIKYFLNFYKERLDNKFVLPLFLLLLDPRSGIRDPGQKKIRMGDPG